MTENDADLSLRPAGAGLGAPALGKHPCGLALRFPHRDDVTRPPIMSLFVVPVLALLYFLPTIIAAQREKSNTVGIFTMNLLWGWTFVGWVIALVWALSRQSVDKPAPEPVPAHASAPRLCSHCGKYSQPDARLCASCGVAF